MSNMRQGDSVDSIRGQRGDEPKQIAHCCVRTGRMSDLNISMSAQPVFVVAKLYLIVGFYRFQFQNISAYSAFAICRDLWTFDVLINWKGKLIFIIWLIDPSEIVDCNGKMKNRVHIYWITEIALHPTPSLTAAWAFNCIQVGARRVTDVVPGVETPHATRPTPISAKFMQLKTCFNCRSAATMEP